MRAVVGGLMGRLALVGGLALLAGTAATTARAANTDLYLDYGLAADQGLYWIHYLDYVNHGSTNNAGDTMQILYQTATGITGTSRDSFQFWGGAAFGVASSGNLPNSNTAGFAAPEIGSEWFYNLIDPTVKQGEPEFEILTVGPTVQVNGPNGNTHVAGYGAGADQWSFNGGLIGTYRLGRFTTTFEPASLTYAATNQNDTVLSDAGGTPTVTRLRGGLSGSFGAFNVGYDVSPTLTIGVYQAWNEYSFSGAKDTPRSAEGTAGPMVNYTGLNDSLGVSVAATVQVDYYHTSNLPQGYFISMYLSKKF